MENITLDVNDSTVNSLEIKDEELPRKTRNYKRNKRFKIYRIHSVAMEETTPYFLGELCIGSTEKEFNLGAHPTQIRAYFENEFEEEFTLVLIADNEEHVVKGGIDINILRGLLIWQQFALDFHCKKNENVFINIYMKKPFTEHFSGKHCILMKQLFSILYSLEVEDGSVKNISNDMKQLQPSEINQLYRDINTARSTEEMQFIQGDSLSCVQHKTLLPKLRPYQEQAVHWMIHKEKIEAPSIDVLHPLYMEITLKSGETVYFDKFTGSLKANKPRMYTESHLRGGILADEMGLGKTVELLACILCHPLNDGSYLEINEPESVNSNSIDVNTSNDLAISVAVAAMEDEETNSNKSTSSKVPRALQLWYKTELKRPRTLRSAAGKMKIPGSAHVRCVCGQQNATDALCACIVCGKIQHAKCNGYNRQFGAYKCPQCWIASGNRGGDRLQVKGTLIVCPRPLKRQWFSEINRHIEPASGFKVFLYDGYQQTPIYPAHLKHFDVVITTYNVLQQEFHWMDVNDERNAIFRQVRKYSPPVCPLVTVKWWRLCLDEAQMVESPTNLVSSMVRKFDTYNRWAITGTPISKNIADFFGLINYLKIEPYCDLSTWTNILLKPYIQANCEQPMLKFLTSIMWRTSKIDVLDQINIPEQTIKEHALSFSAVEKHFYKCEHIACSTSFGLRAQKFGLSKRLNDLDRMDLKHILNPFTSLRQLCTFTNTLSNNRYLAARKSVKTMKDLLDALISKNAIENEEHLRIVISCLNGMAGIYLLQENISDAIKTYVKVLKLHERFTSVEDTPNSVNCDTLQIVHTVYNLRDALSWRAEPSLASVTFSGQTLDELFITLQTKYTRRLSHKSYNAFVECRTHQNSVDELQGQFQLDSMAAWYTETLQLFYSGDYANELTQRIHNALTNANVQANIPYDSIVPLTYQIGVWFDRLLELRRTAINVILIIFGNGPVSEDVDVKDELQIQQRVVLEACNCHLRPEEKKKKKSGTDQGPSAAKKVKRGQTPTPPKCGICVANDCLKQYEMVLFSMEQRTFAFKEMQLIGAWKPTAEELIIKNVVWFLKMKMPPSERNECLILDGETHLNLIEALKKEFKDVRKLWTVLDQQVCGLDELEMCKMRFRLALPTPESPISGEQFWSRHNNNDSSNRQGLNRTLQNLTSEDNSKKTNFSHVLRRHELPYQLSQMNRDQIRNFHLLEKNLGTRSYLLTLRRHQYEGQAPDPCPICQGELVGQWSIIPCGHTYCVACLQSLIETMPSRQLRRVICCVCRATFPFNDISFIQPSDVNPSDDAANIEILGSFSVKVESIIKLVLHLRQCDEHVKIIIFSNWITVLMFLRAALSLNSVSCQLINNSRVEQRLYKFKEENVTALLMPISLGGKGLNITEATHVILVEPLLSSRDELQAISRIHRIGQLRPTVVHKFYVKNSIEENIHRAGTTSNEDWDSNNSTLSHLMSLFNYEDESSSTND